MSYYIPILDQNCIENNYEKTPNHTKYHNS